jgi:hypothetical protein
MKYIKPAVLDTCSAVVAIQSTLNKSGIHTDGLPSPGVYEANE